jgi:hypothetical protein
MDSQAPGVSDRGRNRSRKSRNTRREAESSSDSDRDTRKRAVSNLARTPPTPAEILNANTKRHCLETGGESTRTITPDHVSDTTAHGFETDSGEFY